MNITYVSLQGTQEGQAAHAHVHEIIKGLERRSCRVELYSVQYRRSPGRLARALTMLTTQIRAARSLRRTDLIYVRLHFTSFPIVWYAALVGKMVVTEVNGTTEDALIVYPELKRVRRLLIWCNSTQLKRAQLAVCVTEGLAQWVREMAPELRVAIVSNGADTELFDPARASSEASIVQLPKKFVVFFGALSPWQGIGTMIRAVEDPNWPAGVSLVVVGDGPDRHLVEEASRANPDRVTYLGHQPYRAVPPIVSQSLGSLIVKEGPFQQGGLLPLKLYESLACDVPVIVTDYPGIADVVRSNQFGYVVQPGASSELARRVADLVTGTELKRGREWVVKGNSWDARAAETLNEFARLGAAG